MSPILEIHGFGWQIHDLGDGFLGGLPLGKEGEQGARLHGLNDQSVSLLAHDGLIAWQFELAGNPQRLVATVLEQADMAFGEHKGVLRCLAYIMA